jgi:hypothetical protein
MARNEKEMKTPSGEMPDSDMTILARRINSE